MNAVNAVNAANAGNEVVVAPAEMTVTKVAMVAMGIQGQLDLRAAVADQPDRRAHVDRSDQPDRSDQSVLAGRSDLQELTAAR